MDIPWNSFRKAGRGSLSQCSKALSKKRQSFSPPTSMPKAFYKHKALLDEHLLHRRLYPLLNAHFNVKHIRDDLHLDGLPDTAIYELAVKQGRIILTTNVKDFRPLLREECPG